ncbi:mucoidy inhibitor MuiA family protein [Dysgonomonas sp. Marseille-P4677]|uniref:DUF4139 domain-containing protein n=1 Tax=Dysgonomonas sp. Marseille-P4677 TaxID=2364790 RepID=UPI0019129396|nr:DUF4139 domain-containing protein [Dysgonomonas sp. Marseille-P4677]MBK5721084.1 mucoidy inhibitor MuiA family protein [Dysgonomonas sp. Marseille-P4677]
MRKYKLFAILLSVVLSLPVTAQDQKEIVLKTEASEVTVFINGAQILRKKTVDLLPGRTKVRFTNLSPYIDAKSVQIKMDGEAMVMSVNHQSEFVDSLKKPVVVKTDVALLKEIENKITIAKTEREVIKEEQAFLTENRKIGGANTGVSLASLRETANYYRERISALKNKDNALFDNIETLEKQRHAILNNEKQDGNTQIGPTRIPIGEVVVEVECKKATRVNIDLTYYVKNASWYPTYDIRAINTEKPIQLVYKANVHQNTKEDWKNVKLKISSADPNQGNVVPQLKTYLLNYYTAPPRYNVSANDGQITGLVTDGVEPLIGVSVVVKGTTIGTVTDLNGNFSLAIPQNGKELVFSYVGFISQTLPISQSFMNIRLEESQSTLDEVVVVGYGTTRKKELTGAVAGLQVQKSEPKLKSPAIKEFARTDIAMPTAQVENQTVVEFEIKTPYSIKSDNKNTTIEVDRYELPADYEYFAIPKISKDAFLLANITDWEKYNLLEGEANIFFENTYIGKTILDTRYVSDTLNISLGRDKSILISREKGKDFNVKKFLGTKKEDTREWKINIRNNKTQSINFVVLDQIPVSTISEIEVNTEALSGGDLNAETGEVKWKLKLKPSEKKELELKYKVKYPKDRVLTIE